MKIKVGVFGSGGSAKSGADVKQLAREVGTALGKYKRDLILITGACSGVPYEAAQAAAKLGVEVWGFSPVRTVDEQRAFTPDDDLSVYSKIIYIPDNLPFSDARRKCMKYRNLLSTAESDGGIVIAGQWGSLNEFTNLIDMQKVTGVLLGSGGIADELPSLMKKINKEGQGEVLFESEPSKLVEQLVNELKA